MFALSESIKKSVKECAVCEASMGALDELLGDPNIQKDAEQLLQKVCLKLPAQDRAEVRSCDTVKCYLLKPPDTQDPFVQHMHDIIRSIV